MDEHWSESSIDIADEFVPGDWVRSVAQALPQSVKSKPFTAGDAVAELGIWADKARITSWENRGNYQSIFLDVSGALKALGPRLRSQFETLLPGLREDASRAAASSAASAFSAGWSQPAAIAAAFRDLCAAAVDGTRTPSELAPLAEILASQLRGPFGRAALGTASRMLTELPGDPSAEFRAKHGTVVEEVTLWLGPDAALDDLTLASRLRAAERILIDFPQSGEIVAWLLYSHAEIDRELLAGSITLLEAEWALREANKRGGEKFTWRDELRSARSNRRWESLERMFEDGVDRGSHVLARVDLGHRPLDGAVEEAARRVDALLSIAVGAGGAEWELTNISMALVDDHTQAVSQLSYRSEENSNYDLAGSHRTAALLSHWTAQLGDALAGDGLPEFLVEALQAVREASLLLRRNKENHSRSHSASRVATALEDHAVELLASLANVAPESLISILEPAEVNHHLWSLVRGALLAPLARNEGTPRFADEVGALKREISYADLSGARPLALKKLWEHRNRLRTLPVSPAERVAFDQSLKAISSAKDELTLRAHVQASVTRLRLRHRRVRNAITHGNPVTAAAIDSVRDFSDRTARAAIGLALEAVSNGQTFADALQAWSDGRAELDARIMAGESFLERSIH